MKQLLQHLKTGETYLADVPAPVAGPGQMLVRVRASVVSAGTERMLIDFARSGLLGKARRRPDLLRQILAKARREGWLAAWQSAQGRLKEPLMLGYSCAGVIEAVGEGVEGFAPGDRVACAGAGYANHAEFVTVPQNLCVRLPAEAPSFEEAAFTTLGAIALQGLRLSEARLGESVAVIGLGLLGQLSGRLARAAGCRVFGIDLDERRLELARLGGFDAAVPRSGAAEAAGAFTEGHGFDCILICADASSSDPIELAGTIARDRAAIVAVGNVGLSVPRNVFYRKELTLKVSRSYGPGRYDPAYEEAGLDYPYSYVRWTERRNMEEFVRLLASGAVQVSPLITHRFPIASGPKAYELIAGDSAAHFLGVVLTYEGVAAPIVRMDRKSRVAVPSGGVGVLGAGQFASAVMLPILKRSGAPLRGIASASGARAKAAADRFGFSFAASRSEEVLGDPEVSTIVILTRHDQHAAQVYAALAAGKNVFVEKPLCLTIEELEQIEKTLDSAAAILAVGFNRRFAPFSQKLKRSLPAGPKVIQIRVNAGVLSQSHWALDPAQGGRLLGEGCHFIDWANFIVGASPQAADCWPIGRQAAEQDWSLRLCYPEGSVVDIVYTSAGDGSAGKERYEVHCGGISAVLDDFRRLTIHSQGRARIERAWLKADKGHESEWRAFWSAVREGRPAPVPWREIYASTRAALAAQESLRSGKPVEVRT